MNARPLTPTPMTRDRFGLTRLFRIREVGLIAIVLIVSVVATISIPAFRNGVNLRELLNNAAIVAIVAIGESLVLLSRQIDLSIGAILGLAAFITGSLISQMSGLGGVGVTLITLLLPVFIGIVLGLMNGLLISFARMPAIIATLATLSIYSGLQVVVSGGSQVYAYQVPTWLSHLYTITWLGIGSFVWIGVAWVILFSFVVRMLRWGRDLYAMGSNPEAARYMAIPTRRRTIEAFVVCGALAGFGGLLYISQYGNVDATAGAGFELTVIAAAVIGGVSLFGGSGSPLGAALGAVLLLEIENVLALLRISIFAQQTLQGVAIICAVAIYALLMRRLQQPASRHRSQPDNDTPQLVETEVQQ
jgi:rhamnose transport system permease protein